MTYEWLNIYPLIKDANITKDGLEVYSVWENTDQIKRICFFKTEGLFWIKCIELNEKCSFAQSFEDYNDACKVWKNLQNALGIHSTKSGPKRRFYEKLIREGGNISIEDIDNK